jgi:hypothetical protein
MRRSMRRTNRGTQRVFTTTWVALALLLGLLGLSFRRPHAGHAKAPGAAPTQQVDPGANPQLLRGAPQPRPANDRNG